MKILCVIDSLGSGGAQRQIVGLALGFCEKGHNVSFLVYHKEDFFRSKLDDALIPVHTIIETNYLLRLLKMRNYIRKGNYDTVLSFLEAASFICEISGLPSRKWKLIVGERNADPRITKSIKSMIYRWFHVLADYVVSNSNANIQLVQKVNPFIPSNKFKVIYNMLDISKWKEAGIWNFKKDGKFKLLIVARHEYQKNLLGLIEAVSLLNMEERGILSIDWYGESRADNLIESALLKIKELKLNDIFNFYNPTLEIRIKMEEADAIGLFSLYEGLPNVICEAMTLGKTIIASAISDIPKLVSRDSLLFDPYKPESIKDAISYLLTLNKINLINIGNENKKRAEILFDRERIINEYLTLM